MRALIIVAGLALCCGLAACEDDGSSNANTPVAENALGNEVQFKECADGSIVRMDENCASTKEGGPTRQP